MNPPPMLRGLPVLGHALELRKDPIALFRRGYDAHGGVFGIKLAIQPAVVLVGPEHLRFFFEQTDTVLSMKEVYGFLTPIIGGEVLFTASREEYDEQRRIMLPAFHGKKLKSYVGEMVAEVDAWLATLGDAGQLDLAEVTERLTMAIAARAVFGAAFRDRLGPEITRLYRDLSGGLEFVIPTWLPLPRFRRRDRALRRLQQLFGEVVRERRANPTAYDDFLQVLVEATYLGAARIPDEAVVTMLIGLLFGGRENTAGHLEWCLVEILRHRAWRDRVTDEADRVLAAGPLSYDRLKELEVLGWCLEETDRLRPMSVMLIRRAATAFEIGGYRVPEGWVVVAGIGLSHRLPSLWKDPEVYDPSRFDTEAREVPYSLANFGGGIHKCWATAFVKHEVRVAIAMLLSRFDVELVDPAHPTETNDIGVYRPKRPSLVRYRRRARP